LNLAEARKTQFRSLHDCFIRELKEGARPVDMNQQTIVSPCDAVVGAHGKIDGVELIQAKGFPYTLMDLLADAELVDKYRDGIFVTLRLKSTMYHRFHAPYDCHVSEVNYISGDTWNVNPVALKRVERLYCKNERAVINLQLNGDHGSVTLVPVAAILVASIRLKFLQQVLDLKYKGPNHIACDASFRKGQEMGYFQHGSTIIVFGTQELNICANVKSGDIIKMGQPLLQIR
ncbi:MAG: archaetidylserine decarboxylase, partial [Gammaproteobacteria bacterium]